MLLPRQLHQKLGKSALLSFFEGEGSLWETLGLKLHKTTRSFDFQLGLLNASTYNCI